MACIFLHVGLLADCKTYFGCENLYTVLGIERNASDAELKNAYRTLSLLYHPDRVAGNMREDATRKFQTLSKVYNILADQNQRALYDASLIGKQNVWSAETYGGLSPNVVAFIEEYSIPILTIGMFMVNILVTMFVLKHRFSRTL